jgi:SNF2 family DNA or RNA helicase
MQIFDNKAVLLRVRNPQQILNTIPKSKQLSDGRVAVNWGLEEMQVLKNIGVKKVPSPINRAYNWPGLYTPFAHQRTTAEFLTLHRRAFCFSQQGSGKTAAAAWAADYLITAGIIQRVLIVCPLSIMDVAWRSDFFKTIMHRKVDIAHGNANKRKAVIESDAEFVITNYDTVVNSLEDLKYGRFDLIICDEATYLKNVQTKRWKALKQLVGPNTWLWMMTGTPAAQSPEDAYGLAKLVNPDAVPKYFTGFRDMVMYKLTQFKYIPRPDSKQIVHEVLQPAIRFTKAECMDLPDMITVKRRVELTTQQTKYYAIMKKKMVVEAAGEQITAANAAVKLGRLLQISAGAAYSEDGETVEFDITTRYNVLMEVINETENKVLIFAPFRSVIEILASRLNSDGISAAIINGSVSASNRTDIFQRFQTTDSPRVLVIQPQAAAHGVTLTAADTVVWWGPTSSVEIYEQANARVHRSGQKNKCTVVQLQGSEAEAHVFAMLETKVNVHSAMIDLYKKVLA